MTHQSGSSKEENLLKVFQELPVETRWLENDLCLARFAPWMRSLVGVFCFAAGQSDLFVPLAGSAAAPPRPVLQQHSNDSCSFENEPL